MNIIMAKEIKIAPSLLSANFADLRSDLEKINRSEADWLHLDIICSQYIIWLPGIEICGRVE